MKETNKPADILVVDDTLANLKILVSMLDQQGYSVRPVNSGAAGLRAAQLAKPDLILLDIQMPETDGFEVCRRLKADGETGDIPVIFISALDDIDDKVQAFQAGGVDYITKPFQLEEVLARVETHLEIQRLRRQDQLRIREQEQLIAELDAFAHTVAHDLKSPLGVIGGFAGLLTGKYTTLNEEKRQFLLDKIEQGVFRMDGIIKALLLLASVRKIDEVAIEPLCMADILAGVQERQQLFIQKCEVEISMPDVWPPALGYAPWVEEIWANYISNAIKYGGRPCRIEFGADAQPEGMARFWIKDNGEGLTPEEQAKLFTPFTQLEQANVEGHGLGLSIVRRIVEKLGGTAGVESAPNQGSLFFFTLPQSP